MSLKTPKYEISNYPEVYEPSEDTFLFLDAIETEIPYLRTLHPQIAIEVGSGSGIVVASLSQIFGSLCLYLSTDINPQACLATKTTASLNNISIEACRMDLLSCFRENIFDIILFNPPYVITETAEVAGMGINRAWAGGLDGRSVTDKLLCKLPKLLSDKGVFYCVLLKENKPAKVVEAMEEIGLSHMMVLERRIPGEHLYIYKFFRK